MAHLRRKSRRNAAIDDDGAAQMTELEPVGLIGNGELVETSKDVVMHDHVPSEAMSKEAEINGEMGGVDAEIDPEKLKAEEALWESFREEFHEVIEHLPLYIHRQFTLMRDLDEQTSQHSTDLMSDIRRYIGIRSKLAGISLNAPLETSAHRESAVPLPSEASTTAEPHAMNPIATFGEVVESQHLTETGAKSVAEPSNSVALLTSEQQVHQLVDGPSVTQSVLPLLKEDISDEAPVPWDATRTLLPRIGWLTDEILRTSEEKIDLAKTIYEMINRHVRQLDHSIEEQESALKIANGTHIGLHPWVVKELNAPRWHRPAQATLIGDDVDDEETPEPVQDEVLKTPAKKRRGRPPNKPPAQATPSGAPTGLKITLKLPQASQADGVGDELYCICQRPSSGTMVMCDNENCHNGSWFHLDCIGLKEAPANEALWYCPQCAPAFSTAQPKAAKRRRR